MPGGTLGLLAAWGSSPTDVWLAGKGGTAVHYDGQAWTLLPPPTDRDIVALSGTSANDVWALPSRPAVYSRSELSTFALYHWDGQSWSTVPMASPMGDGISVLLVHALHASAPGQVAASGYRLDFPFAASSPSADQMTEKGRQLLLGAPSANWPSVYSEPGVVATSAAPVSVWARAGRVWALFSRDVGLNLQEWDGNSIHLAYQSDKSPQLPLPETTSSKVAATLFGVGEGTPWLCHASIQRSSGLSFGDETWSKVLSEQDPSWVERNWNSCYDASASSSSNVWVLAGRQDNPLIQQQPQGLMRWNGSSWQTLPFDATTRGVVRLWAVNASTLFAYGGLTVPRGTSLTTRGVLYRYQ